ncbi:hypothetical protein FSARC_5163 [Fusarium sarcochroum]|uniref:Uncharacterized protein n=1 Tax=Fusarium sarcochroum TaxID=1208366 RepID=A0A8H4TZY4_9HYPO|nr:hypothetical protein FSARC_5163 [Fusarium sarcochroum]
MNGVDEVGSSYFLQAIEMADRIKIFDPPPVSMDDRMKAARGLTAWGTFSFQSLFSFHFFRPPMMKSPPRYLLLDPKDNSAWYPELWIMYPLSQNPIPIQLGDHFKAVAEFYILLNDVGKFAFPKLQPRRKLTLDEAWGFYLTLKEWYNNLPDSLSPSQAVLPFQLLVHLHYFNIVMVLLEPFTTAEVQTTHSHDLPQETPENVVIDAKVAFETIQRLYYLRHGFDTYDPLLLQFQLLLGFMSLKTLSSDEKMSSQITESVRSTLALALKGVRGHANNTYLGVTTFRLLRDKIKEYDTQLLQGLADVAQEEETVKSLIASHVKSQYPINVMSMEEDPEEKRIGAMVAAYKEMDLSDGVPVEGGNGA